jgi:CRISPR-associated RAMP protein (TIGR02581 family)
MHGKFYNEAVLELSLRPRTPLLIASGAATGLDPTLPEIQFIRTHRRKEDGTVEEVIYIPGSSFRGVLRSHAERLVRSVHEDQACRVTEKTCLQQKLSLLGKKETELEGSEAYKNSCYVCRLFGNTGIAARIRVADFYPTGPLLTEIRPGVAIDRVTGGVVQGLFFQMELVTDGEFVGQISLRNFTLGQLGLLAASLLDIGDGLVPLGHGKSRGLGRVSLNVKNVTFRFLQPSHDALRGVGALADEQTRKAYALPKPEDEAFPMPSSAKISHEHVFFLVALEAEAAKDLFEKVASHWVKELEVEKK